MVAVFVRFDTSHGEDGSHVVKMNPTLWGKTLDEVTGLTAGMNPTELMKENVDETLTGPSAKTGGPEVEVADGDEEAERPEYGNVDEATGGAMTEMPIAPGYVEGSDTQDAADGASAQAPAEATSDLDLDPSLPLLSKTALRKLDRDDLDRYANARNIDPAGATKEEIVAALHGE